MKSLFWIFLCCFISIANAQDAFKGKGDKKYQIGTSLQDNGLGLMGTFDIGISNKFSVGAYSSYIFILNKDLNADFQDRFSFKARVNLHLAPMMKNYNFDLYPGLNIGLKNVGAHLGARYLISEKTGVFFEASLPITKFNTNELTPEETLNNQPILNLGVTFDISYLWH